ncbi:12347_t:CDS:2, partial [Ambispora leptoticha]
YEKPFSDIRDIRDFVYYKDLVYFSVGIPASVNDRIYRCMIRQVQECNVSGWKELFGFYAYGKPSPKTVAFYVEEAFEPHRIIISKRPQNLPGFSKRFVFWAFEYEQEFFSKPVTIEKLGHPERHVLRIQALNNSTDKGGQLVNTFHVVDTVYWG